MLIGQKQQLASDTIIGIILVENSLGPNNSMPAADNKHIFLKKMVPFIMFTFETV